MNVSDLFSLDGKVALITGARRGLGRATALTLAEAGANVAICDIIIEGGELEAVSEEIKKKGRRTLVAQTDVSQKSEVDSLIQRVVAELGAIDILVNNAGIGTAGMAGGPPFFETPEAEWDRVIDVNLKGCYFCATAAGKIMIERKHGKIISIASVDGISGGGARHLVPPELIKTELPLFASPYQISKAGIIMLTKVLSRQLSGYGIRVNAIAPTGIKTDITRSLWSVPERLEYYEARVPLKRMAEPSDIASIALFLASDASCYITGHTLVADGGILA
jgi:NAD(P)-dependent dehydrogenase (short-subunit alcohol dehydrogenase family)